MKVKNRLMPNKKQVSLLQENGPDGPVFMINLVKFKTNAIYDDGRDTNLSGREAYGVYGKGVVQLLPKYGAEVVLGTHLTELIIGEVEDLWDEITIVKYPSRQSLNEMTSSQEWTELNVHRLAGLEGQLNIESINPRGKQT